MVQVTGDIVQQCTITDQERINFGHVGAIEEAISKLEVAYEQITTTWPIGNGATINIVITCVKPRYS